MNINFKRTFYSSLLAVLVVISNLIGLKYTHFGDLVLSLNFITFPFIFLCILLIHNLYNRKAAATAILSAVFIQIVILLSYILAINLGNQMVIPDIANSVNIVFKVNNLYIITNLLALLVSSYILEYIYDYFRIIRHSFVGIIIGLISANILYGLLTIPIINYNFGSEIILNMVLCHVIMSFIMTIIITILYYLLQEKSLYLESNFKITKTEKDNFKSDYDKAIDEVIKISNGKKRKQYHGQKSKNSNSKKKKESKNNVNK